MRIPDLLRQFDFFAVGNSAKWHVFKISKNGRFISAGGYELSRSSQEEC